MTHDVNYITGRKTRVQKTSFCHPANRLLGPCKSTKIICDQTNEGQPEDFIFTSSALTLLRAVSVQHPTCALFTDACEGMEPTVGCGYTYMVTFAGRLLLRGNNLLQQRVRYQVLCDNSHHPVIITICCESRGQQQRQSGVGVGRRG